MGGTSLEIQQNNTRIGTGSKLNFKSSNDTIDIDIKNLNDTNIIDLTSTEDKPTAGSITRINDLISSIALIKSQGTDNITVNRDSDDLISSIVSVYSGITKTTTFTRTGGRITSFSIT
jgi:hypothetical protein